MTLGSGPLKPGLGVKKKLPEVGDLHITGIVNSSHDMESFHTSDNPFVNYIPDS